MTERRILIDGYNVIGADSVLSGLQRQSLEVARTALINRLAGSTRFLDDMVEVIFDGVTGPGSLQRFGPVAVIFSSSGSTADDVIKSRARAMSDPQKLVVVTNDVDVREYCRLLGCTVTGSENLLEQLSVPKKMRRPRAMASDDSLESVSRSTAKRGNPKRKPKPERNRREYRF